MLLVVLEVEGRYHFHKNQQKTPSPSPSPSPPPISSSPATDDDDSSCVFNVKDYGAIGEEDGSSDDTAAFVAAWKEACGVESATILVPADTTFTITSTIFSGPCKPGLVFQVDGILMPPSGPNCWPNKDSTKQWLVFYKLNNMTLTGTGTIQGNGKDWWDLPCKPHRGPNGSTLPGPCDSPTVIKNIPFHSIQFNSSSLYLIIFYLTNIFIFIYIYS